GYERAVWAKLAEAGWMGVMVEEAHGGMGLGLDAACAFATEVGRNPIPEPYLSGAWHAGMVLGALEPSALRDKLLASLASGEAIIGVAWQGNDGRPGLTVQTQGERLLLQGERHWVFPARADGWLVISDQNDVVWVPATTDGVQCKAHARVDGSLAATLN